MSQFLLAAEADKIQDLIFRSAKLRGVVGGSEMLNRFCNEVPLKLIKKNGYNGEVVVSDGGTFRICFTDADDKTARLFGTQLAEVYRQTIGGQLTVATPQPIPDPVEAGFKKAHEKSLQALRQSKSHRPFYATTVQFPYAALCTFCGQETASSYHLLPEETRGQYICKDCWHKQSERRTTGGEEALPVYIHALFEKIIGSRASLDDFKGPGQHKTDDPASDLGRLDPRNYVAYLLADGNDMGQAFADCTKEQLCQLSKQLKDVLYESLADPIRSLMQTDGNLPERYRNEGLIPVLPLIAGGDDLFALIPARWALDIARRFAEAYMARMTKLFKSISHCSNTPPSLAVAVVICKAKHPYYLAHQRGEEMLHRIKHIAKQQRIPPATMIDFEVILGNRLKGAEFGGRYRPTLAPYWLKDPPECAGITLRALISQREALEDLPNKRRVQLRALFDRLSSITSEHFDEWIKELQQLQGRVEIDLAQGDRLNKAVIGLGGPELSKMQRKADRDDWLGHGLPDLIRVWNYANKVK